MFERIFYSYYYYYFRFSFNRNIILQITSVPQCRFFGKYYHNCELQMYEQTHIWQCAAYLVSGEGAALSDDIVFTFVGLLWQNSLDWADQATNIASE